MYRMYEDSAAALGRGLVRRRSQSEGLALLALASLLLGCKAVMPASATDNADGDAHFDSVLQCRREDPENLSISKRVLPDAFRRCWYSGMLDAMGESPLAEAASDASEAYRFLWLRSFHPPISIRVALYRNQATLEAKELSGLGGYEPGVLSHHIRRPLSQADWLGFKAVLADSGFWSPDPPTESRDLIIADGAQWILEGLRNREQRLVDLHGAFTRPPYATPQNLRFRAALEKLLELSGLKVPADDVY